ncbi:hypothetical protein Enr10x_20630 [Gimesia panareensis]|uniref:Uncharacterized protein n=1 Tax=Gimesia panareensis TaxID=2527978 RepID=A0A517Q538_9PLAN|nr:hypothetical protein [Gimesia panareensis]QDT26753.1 hypothetical protein Enr10x_20630 [Gimesia panareensis]
MKGLNLRVLTAALALGLSPLLLSAQLQSVENGGASEGAVTAEKPGQGASQSRNADPGDNGSVAAEKPEEAAPPPKLKSTPGQAKPGADQNPDAAGKMQGQPKIKIDPIVREGTAHLDIDETTRSRYTYFKGHWWFYMGNGEWMISKDGKWEPVDTSKYRKSSRKMSQSGTSQRGGPARSRSGSSNYYNYDDSPAFGNYYGTGSYYNGGYTRPFYNNNGRGDYGRGYYGNGFYGRGYYGRGYYGNGYYGRGLYNGSSNGRWGTGSRGTSGGLGLGTSGGAPIGLGP